MDWDWSKVPQEALSLLSPRQREAVELSHLGRKEAASVMGLSDSRKVREHLDNARKKLRLHGYDPESGMVRITPDPFQVKSRSEFVKIHPETGEEVVTHYWNKTEKGEQAKQDALKDFVEGLKQEIKPAKPVKPAKEITHDPELLSAIVIGDAHLGCYSFAPETKHSDFDTDIATADIRAAVDDLVARSPEAETGVLVNVGDFLHSNTSHNATWKGTPVDVDTRHHRVMRAAGMVLRYCIDRMLEKYKNVILVVARGNHDPDAAVGVQLMLEFYYEQEKRVTVLPTQGFFHYMEFGKWLFGFNHGDKVKPQKLVNVMARDMSEAWGRTSHRMWFLGHVHHEKVLEMDGCKLKTFGTLAPPDGWHASMGYGAESTMELITFKKSGGTHSTFVYDIPRPIIEPDARIV